MREQPATGTLGTHIVRQLQETGHEVMAASRSAGVDAVTGAGLDAALAGADVVVDCLNIQSMSTVKALEFFTTTAGNVSEAARRQEGPEVRVVAVRGPEVATAAEVARRIIAVKGSVGGRSPRTILEAPLFGKAMARGGLIPQDAIVDEVTLDRWLAGGAR